MNVFVWNLNVKPYLGIRLHDVLFLTITYNTYAFAQLVILFIANSCWDKSV